MTGFYLRKINSALLDGGRNTAQSARIVLFAAFVLGLVFGSLVGIYSDLENFEAELSGVSGGLGRAWVFFLLLLMCSTSLLGLVLIPALMCVRGFLFSCSVAVLYFTMGIDGLLVSLLGSAVPLCFLLPCYVVVGDDCFGLSRRLACLWLGRGGYCGVLFPLRHLVTMIFMIFFDVLYSACLAPVLI